MTQEEFAAELKRYYTRPVKEGKKGEEDKGISKSTVSSWEKGLKTPPMHDPEFVDAIAKVFDVRVLDVLAGAGYDVIEEVELTDKEAIILEAYRRGDFKRAMQLFARD